MVDENELANQMERHTNPHNSPGLTTSLTPPAPVFNPVLGDPGVLTVDNLLV
jgi:hypothetical protein